MLSSLPPWLTHSQEIPMMEELAFSCYGVEVRFVERHRCRRVSAAARHAPA